MVEILWLLHILTFLWYCHNLKMLSSSTGFERLMGLKNKIEKAHKVGADDVVCSLLEEIARLDIGPELLKRTRLQPFLAHLKAHAESTVVKKINIVFSAWRSHSNSNSIGRSNISRISGVSNNFEELKRCTSSSSATSVSSAESISVNTDPRQKILEKLQLVFVECGLPVYDSSHYAKLIEEAVNCLYSYQENSKVYLIKCRDCIFNLKKNAVSLVCTAFSKIIVCSFDST